MIFIDIYDICHKKIFVSLLKLHSLIAHEKSKKQQEYG